MVRVSCMLLQALSELQVVVISSLLIWARKFSFQFPEEPAPQKKKRRRIQVSDSSSEEEEGMELVMGFNSWTAGSFLAATKQLNEWYFLSVCLSVCLSVRLSVRHTFLTMFPSSYHHEIFRSYYQWQKWRPCRRSRSEVKGQGHRGQHPT